MKSSGSCLECRLDEMIFFKGCPRCHGDIVEKDDLFGWYLSCIQCGCQREVEEKYRQVRNKPEPLKEPRAA